MNKMIAAVLLTGLAALPGPLRAQEEEGKDHPLFKRMPGFIINAYDQKDFDAHEFVIDPHGDGNERVEGKKTSIEYWIKEGAKAPSALQIIRNHVNALAKLGGISVAEWDGNRATLNLQKSGRDVWVDIDVSNGGEVYALVIVERGAMKQEISSSDMLEALEREGRVALYIHFDTGQAAITPVSRPIVDEVVKLLSANPGLKLSVEGHTDDIGGVRANLELSKKRAAAVVAALTAAGIDAGRLKPAGFGQSRPLADNGADQGRAKNRRVELVKL